MKTIDIKKLVGSLLLVMPMLFVGCATQQVAREPAAGQPASVAPVQKAPEIAGHQPEDDDAQRLLLLEGTVNARTFAGLQGKHGPIPANAFVRTADLAKLTQTDRDLLAKFGVALDVDLRTLDEETNSPDVLATDGRFAYKRISLLGEEKIDLSKLPPSLGQMYVQSLEANQPQFRQVFQSIAGQKDGGVLFHCTAGKDRTGMVAALLLDLAGVEREDIVHNYAVSGHYYAPMAAESLRRAGYAELLKANPNLAALSGAPPEAIEAFLDNLHAQYGGAENYLETIGLSDGEVNSLLTRLGQ